MRKCIRLFSVGLYAIALLATPYGVVFASETDGKIDTSQEQVAQANTPKDTNTSSSEQHAIQPENTGSTLMANESLPLPNEDTNKPHTSAPVNVTTEFSSAVQPGPETTPPIIITSLQVSSTIEYIELLNQSDAPIQLNTIRFIASNANESSCEVRIATTGWLLSGAFVAIASPANGGAGMYLLSNDCVFTDTIQRIEVYQAESRLQLIDGIVSTVGKPWLRHKSTVSTAASTYCNEKVVPSSLKQTGSAANDYAYCANMPLVGTVRSLRTSELYIAPATTAGLKIVEIMSDSVACAPGDKSSGCYDYIKLQNTSSTPLNLALYRLRIGSSGTTASASNTFHWHQATLHPGRDELVLEPGKFFTVTKKDNGENASVPNGTGYVWLEDYYGTQLYESVRYDDMNLAGATGKSWMYDEAGTWTYGIPSPYTKNVPYIAPIEVGGKGSVSSQLKPCRDDQYRSEETNRCRNIATATTITLKPCKEGQYRSEETNRCRSIASAAATVLKPCADDQFRNPASGRCKKIASADQLADCGEGRERNPATNRCRNVLGATIGSAKFAPKPVEQAISPTIGWVSFGVIAAAAAGYGVWEWRREIGALLAKLISRQ